MPDHPDIAEIALHVSAADRFALLAAAECKGGAYWTAYPVGARALARGGTLTPLGLAVRSYLQEHGEGR